MITNAALKNGFTGGLIVDYPNSKKAKKYYLFLMAGHSERIQREAKAAIEGKALLDEKDNSHSRRKHSEDSDEDMNESGQDSDE